MDNVRYLRALTRSWWLILITMIAGGVGGYLVYQSATPQYRASTQFVVKLNAPGMDAVSAQALAGARAQALAQIAPTPPAVHAALAAAGRTGASPAVTASASSSNPFLTISVTDQDAAVTSAVANAYAKTLVTSASSLLGQSSTPYKLTQLAGASIPQNPYSPDWKREIGLGLAVGLVLGLAIALLRETFNRTVRESEGLRELTGLTVLGTVPKDTPKKLLPAMSDPRSARAEAYRQVRTTLLNQTQQRPLTVAITSAALGEGKTSVACNVAAIFSRAGHRVALVDADLRRPRVAAFFQLPPAPGLSDVLSGAARLDEALNELEDGLLGVVTAGRIPADPAELLGSQAMVDVLHRLAAQYEFVFVDTPPVLPVTDALVLAPIVDGVVVVVKMEGTTEDRIVRALEGIDRVKANVIGLVPNQAARGTDRDYGYAYRYTATRRRTDRGAHETRIPADPAHLVDSDDFGAVTRVQPKAKHGSAAGPRRPRHNDDDPARGAGH